MNYEEFNMTVCQRLAKLADTETNRKRKTTDSEINEISRMIQKQKAALDADIAAGKYDDAVTAKAEISRLESKQEILMGVAKELDAIPEYDDKDLRKLSDDAVNYYKSVLKGLYEDRLKILEKLDENYQMMEKSKDSYNSIKKILDSKASDFNYACGRVYAIPYSDSESLSEPWKIRKDIQSIEEELRKRGWTEPTTA